MSLVDPTRIDIDCDPTEQRMRGIARHGNVPFDVPFISEIDDNLWQGGCDGSLVLPAHIAHVVSLYPWENYKVKHDLASFVQFRMYDSEFQAMDQVLELAEWVNRRRQSGPVLVHCQAGLNRSAAVAGAALVLAGRTPDEAIALMRERRSPAVLCNRSFESWLRSLTDD